MLKWLNKKKCVAVLVIVYDVFVVQVRVGIGVDFNLNQVASLFNNLYDQQAERELRLAAKCAVFWSMV